MYDDQDDRYKQQNDDDDRNHMISAENKNFYYEVIKQKPPKQKNTGMLKFVVAMLIVSIVGGSAMGSSYAFVAEYLTRQNVMAQKEQVTPPTITVVEENMQNLVPMSSGYNSISDIASDVGPSIVSIVNNQVISTFIGEYSESGLGSGVIFKEDDEKIYIMTNAHVVEGATSLTVTFLGNTKVAAHIVGMDTLTDIAVVSVNKIDLPQEISGEIKLAPLGDSDSLLVGDLAIAIGTPIDEAYNNTVTVGIISALDRTIPVSSENEMSLIQTDAAINPGNSGGALIGPTGEVIGINTIKLVDSQVEGMGFAIPINDVKEIVDELLENGRIIRPSLGISGITMSQEMAQYEFPVGVLVASVIPGSSADIAGIRANDIILEFDSQKVTTIDELRTLLDNKKVGDVVTVRISRGNQNADVSVTLTELQQTTTTSQQQQKLPNVLIPN
ncbi:MAG: hypothetical protein BEN19_05065 [Epulopiscium sp. Nuni2H_MBin003]|nr:MAG: hypothetical protein BEN19_05065 [Epulopiscium sp. Nuni2H_MBin003]